MDFKGNLSQAVVKLSTSPKECHHTTLPPHYLVKCISNIWALLVVYFFQSSQGNGPESTSDVGKLTTFSIKSPKNVMYQRLLKLGWFSTTLLKKKIAEIFHQA